MSLLLHRLGSQRAIRASSLFLLFLAVLMQAISALHMGAFWLDEAGSVNMARLPLPEMWNYLCYDSFPIGHFLLYKAWLSCFGWLGAQNALRLLGFLVGSAAVTTFWLLSRLIGGGYPLFGFALFCLNPLIVRYMRTSRPYGLSTLTLLATAYFGFGFLQSGARCGAPFFALWPPLSFIISTCWDWRSSRWRRRFATHRAAPARSWSPWCFSRLQHC